MTSAQNISYAFRGNDALTAALQKLGALKLDGEVEIDVKICVTSPAPPPKAAARAVAKPPKASATVKTDDTAAANSICVELVGKGAITASNAKSKLGTLSGVKALQALSSIAKLREQSVSDLCEAAGMSPDVAQSLDEATAKSRVDAALREHAIGALMTLAF